MRMHGRKVVVSVLLGPHRAALLAKLSGARNQLASNCAADIIYAELQKEFGAEFFSAAAEDERWSRARSI